MSIADFPPPTVDPIVESLISFDPQTGKPSKHLLELLRQLRDYNLGGNRIIPCTASGANLITLTPNNPVTPILERYADHDCFAAVAAANSTAAVTATVVPQTGALGEIKVYKTNGSAQAGNGDIAGGLFYLFFYMSAADGGAGGLILK